MSKLYTKDVALLIFREGRYCERNPGRVSFTFNNPAARIGLQSKLASAMQKTELKPNEVDSILKRKNNTFG